MIRVLCTIFLLSYSLIVFASNEPPIKLSLKEAINLGIKTSDDVEMQKNEVTKMEEKYHEAKSAIYPHINGEVKWTHFPLRPDPIAFTIPGVPPIEIPTKQAYEASVGITATQILWAFGRVFNAINLAEKSLAMSELSKKATMLEIEYQVKNAYYTVLMSKKVLENAQKSYDNVLANRDILRKRFINGRPPKGDNLKMASDVSSRIPPLKEATSNYELAKRYFKMLVDIDESTDLILTDSFTSVLNEYDSAILMDKLMSDDPTLQILRKGVQLNNDLVAIRKANFLPTLSAFGSFNYMSAGENAIPSSEDINKVAAVGIVLSVPIYTGGETNGQLQQAVIERMNSEVTLKKAEKGLTLELKNDVSEYNALIGAYRAKLESMRLMEQTYRMTQEKFMSGNASLTELNDMEHALSGTELSAFASLYRINQLIAKIEKLTVKMEKQHE